MSLEGMANPINRWRRRSLRPYVLYCHPVTVLLMTRTASALGRVCFNSKMEHTLAGSVLCEADTRGRKREMPRGHFLMWPWSPGALPVPSVNRSSGNYSAACLLAPDSKSSPSPGGPSIGCHSSFLLPQSGSIKTRSGTQWVTLESEVLTSVTGMGLRY